MICTLSYAVPVGGELVVYQGEAGLNGQPCTVTLRLPLASTDLRLRCEAEVDSDFDPFVTPQGGQTTTAKLQLDGYGAVDVKIRDVQKWTDDDVGAGTTVFGVVESEVLGGENTYVDEVRCGWTNLPNLALTAQPSCDYSRDHPTVLSAAGWELALGPIPTFQSRAREVWHRGVPVFISHRARLARVDGGQFCAEQALEALQAFHLALSFVLGRFVAPVAPVGYREQEPGWMLNRAWRCHEGIAADGIIPADARKDLTEAVEKLACAFLDSDDTRAIRRRLLVMFAVACHHGVGFPEQRLLTAQAGLEFLHWWKTGSSRREAAALKVTELLAMARIPIDIPGEFPALNELQRRQPDLRTGPRAIAWVRNRAGHPEDPMRLYGIDQLVSEASMLAREYLELLILQEVGYQGRWRRRYPSGHLENRGRVPWAPQVDED